MNAHDFLSLSRDALRDLLVAGHPIDPSALDDSEYRGVSLGLPSPLVKLTWLTFRKTFHRDRGALRGWNVRMEQTGLDGARKPMLGRDGKPRCFGFYGVRDGREYPNMPVAAQHGLVIDYGLGENPRLDPIRRGRDPLVALERGSVERLLGWTYLDVGVGRVGTPSYFLLEREGALSYLPR